ncbi:MAG: multidrug effflux MFS transporter [Rhodospirillales bacterium]|nr:multidrug effflux MFS transporter [Acetobacter sp.]
MVFTLGGSILPNAARAPQRENRRSSIARSLWDVCCILEITHLPYREQTTASNLPPSSRIPGWAIILLLGALSLVTPFSIDMYLPAFGRIATYFHTSTSAVSWSLSTYFIGFAFGQILYGPLLDRFGRKRPLYVGLTLYLIASALCIHPGSLPALVTLRLAQALGGCVAQVAAVAMVRDFFPPEQSARILSLLFLIIGVSPLLAPTIGSIILLWLGWPWIFVALSAFTLLTALAVALWLPEPHSPDSGISLAPRPMLENFIAILTQPQFCFYAFAGAFSFAGLFAYVAGSPIIFMDGFHVSEKTFGIIFAVLTGGFIAGSQLNIALLRRFGSVQIFSTALLLQVGIGLAFLTGTLLNWYGMKPTSALFFLFLSCIGMTYPNAAAVALAPFTRNMGSASALLGFIQMGTGALVSTGIGFFGANSVIALLFGNAFLALAIHALGKRVVPHPVEAAAGSAVTVTH